MAGQPTQPARVMSHVDCLAMLSQFYVHYGLCIVGEMFKLYLYNIYTNINLTKYVIFTV